jgi:hypothetical protein
VFAIISSSAFITGLEPPLVALKRGVVPQYDLVAFGNFHDLDAAIAHF